MPTSADKQVQTFDTLGATVIAPAIIRDRAPLQAQAFQAREPVSFEAAARAKGRPVKPGWEWGPKWSTCWFRLEGAAPPPRRGTELALRFSTDTEAQLWIDGVPHQGLDVNRDLALLPRALANRSGGLVLHVEAACNHPFGADGLQWDTPETHRRWTGPTPGRFIAAELVRVDDTVRRLHVAWVLATQLARELLPPPPPITTHSQRFPENLPWQDGRVEELLSALRSAWREIDPRDPASGAGRALQILEAALHRAPAASTTVCHAVGHAHIDTAWLWPLRETRRKCLRTFSNVLRLMERYPQFQFLCSQAQQYAFVEADSPELFRQISRRVREGRWEPGGAMWIEPDCNVPSGESLVRQILHGTRYWEARFGPRGRQRFLYLPDTFGFPPCLPQIMAQSGLDTFITNKMSWNDTSPMPETTFIWRGLGGAEVTAHFTPGNDYNATNSARELRRGQTNHRTKQLPSVEPARGKPVGSSGARWLQPFGFGDGGGGPTDWMIENAQHAQACDGLPRVRQSSATAFCDALQADLASALSRGEEIPSWSGELYLELHRGTLTTQAWLKQANREAEDALRLAELLLAGAPTLASPDSWRRAKADLDAAWKLLLLNQFHDILPGSSITMVYDDARRDHARIRELVAPLIEEGIDRWAASADTRGLAKPLLAFNPACSRRAGFVGEGSRRRVIGAPALGMRVGEAQAPAPVGAASVRADPKARRAVLENDMLRAELDSLGQVTSLKLKDPALSGEIAGEFACAASHGPLNQLALFEDRPRLWDAWDIDDSHAWKSSIEARPATRWRVVERGPARASVEVTRPLGVASELTQTISLDQGSRRLDIRSRVDWREEHRLLRALFPTDIISDRASFQTQFGRLERPTHVNTPRDRAAFEGAVQRWMDVSDPQRGLAVLNDCKFGGSARTAPPAGGRAAGGGGAGVVLALSLLRSATYPDPQADRGRHEFAYALCPHLGGPGWAGLDEEAEALHRPVLVRPLPARQGGSNGRRGAGTGGRGTPELVGDWSPVEIDAEGPMCVQVSAFKPAEDTGRAIILRLVDTVGSGGEVNLRWNIPLKTLGPVDLLERAIKLPGFGHDHAAGRTSLRLGPFQIVTLRGERA